MAYIKLDPADQEFSKWVRLRDKQCVRCLSPVSLNDRGLPVSHQASHYFGRGKESTRFEPSNVDTLCYGCHIIWGSEDREAYRQFKLSQLGEDGYQKLYLESRLLKKKDRTFEKIKWRQAVKELLASTLN